MTRDEAVAEIKRILGFRTGTTHDSAIIQQLKTTQERLEREPELPYFLRTEVSSITTEASEERIALPSDFLMEWEEDALWHFNTDADSDAETWTALYKDELAFLRKSLPGEGKPQAYAFDGSYFRLFPTPDAEYTIKMIYFGADTVLDTNVENKWLRHLSELLIGDAGAMMAAGMRDASAITVFANMKASGKAKLVTQQSALDGAGRRYVMGGEN